MPSSTAPLAAHQRYIVDELFPAHEVHIIGGPSGSGKTTWLFQFMEDWSAGRDINGYRSHPCAWFYVSCDRSMAGVLRTLDRMSVKLDPKRMASIVDNTRGIGLASIRTFLTSIKQFLPEGGVLFIDGFAILSSLFPASPSNSKSKDANYGGVSAFLIELARECIKHDITIVGTAHSPKTKENDKIPNPRQRVLGSVAWAGCAETIVIIEPTDEADIDNPARMVLILPRNSSPIQLEMAFNDEGRLVERIEATIISLDYWLKEQTPGFIFSNEDLYNIGKHKNVSKRTCGRWLAGAKKDGRVISPTRGTHQKTFTT